MPEDESRLSVSTTGPGGQRLARPSPKSRANARSAGSESEVPRVKRGGDSSPHPPSLKRPSEGRIPLQGRKKGSSPRAVNFSSERAQASRRRSRENMFKKEFVLSESPPTEMIMMTNPLSSSRTVDESFEGKTMPPKISSVTATTLKKASSEEPGLKKKTSLFNLKKKILSTMKKKKSMESTGSHASAGSSDEEPPLLRTYTFERVVEMAQMDHKIGKHNPMRSPPSPKSPPKKSYADRKSRDRNRVTSIRGTVLGGKIKDGLEMLAKKRAGHSSTTEARAAIPLHDALVALSQIHRTAIINDFLRFIVMFGFFYLFVENSHNPVVVHDQTSVVNDLFLYEEFPDIEIYKNFFSIAQQEEVWDWTEGVLIPGLFPEYEWYSDTPIPAPRDPYGYSAQELKVVGSVILRQVRVQPRPEEECKNFGRKCYPAAKESDGREWQTEDFYGTNDDGYNVIIPGGLWLTQNSTVVRSWLPLKGVPCNLNDTRNTKKGLLKDRTIVPKNGEMDPENSLTKGDSLTVWYKEGGVTMTRNVIFDGFIDPSSDNGNMCAFRLKAAWTGPSTGGYDAIAYQKGGYPYLYRENPVEGLFGWRKEYGKGGFYVEFDGDLTSTAASMIVEKLKKGTWSDKATRIISCDFNLYNANTQYVTVMRLHIQFFPSGKVLPSHFVMSFRGKEPTTKQVVLLGFFFITLIFKIGYELKRMYDYRKLKVSIFISNARNLIQWLYIGLNSMALFFWSKVLLDEDVRNFEDVTLMDHQYVDLQRSARLLKRGLLMGGGVVIVSCMNFFRLASLNRSGQVMYRTMVRVVSDLGVYVVLLGMFLTSFAVAGNWVFGTELVNFHNFKASISSVTRFSLGDFDYDALGRTNPKAAGYFFFSFQLVIFVFCLNIIVAVLVDAYDKTSRATKRDSSWACLMPSLTYEVGRDVANMARKLMPCLRGRFLKPVSQNWQAERAFTRAMKAASRRALLQYPPTDLYEYILGIWREVELSQESKKSSKGLNIESHYIDRSEFMQLVGDDAIVHKLFCAFNSLKSVDMVHAVDRLEVYKRKYSSGQTSNRLLTGTTSRMLVSSNDDEYHFKVRMVSRYGAQSKRILSIEKSTLHLKVLGRTSYLLKKRIPLATLCQIERSMVGDCSRVKIYFHGANSNVLDVRFDSPAVAHDFRKLCLEASRLALEKMSIDKFVNAE